MKTVRQQIIDLYPEHDLTDKREYIKSTVKEVTIVYLKAGGKSLLSDENYSCINKYQPDDDGKEKGGSTHKLVNQRECY